MERVKLRAGVREMLAHQQAPMPDEDIGGWIVEEWDLAGSPYHHWCIALDGKGMVAERRGFVTRQEARDYAATNKHPFAHRLK